MPAEISGKGWSIQADDRTLLWRLSESDAEQGLTALRMLSDHFRPEDLERHRASETVYGREFGMLYPLAGEFLNTWGIKCEVVGLAGIQFEAPPPD